MIRIGSDITAVFQMHMEIIPFLGKLPVIILCWKPLDMGFLKRWHPPFIVHINATLFVAGDFEARGLLDACETALGRCTDMLVFQGMEFILCPNVRLVMRLNGDRFGLNCPFATRRFSSALPDLLTAIQKGDVERELAFELSLDMALGAHMRCLCCHI